MEELLRELIGLLNRREESIASVVLEPAELQAWTPPRYHYQAVHVAERQLQRQLATVQPDGWEVFAIPSPTCVVYRYPVDEPDAPEPN